MHFNIFKIFLYSFLFIATGFACSVRQERNSPGQTAVSVRESADQNRAEGFADEIPAIIRQGIDTIQVRTYFTDADIRQYLYDEFTGFYENRDHQLAWYSADGPAPGADELLTALQNAPAEGLEFDYQVDTLVNLRQRLFGSPLASDQLDDLVRLDFLTTSAYLTYASHLLSGVTDPYESDRDWVAEPREKDLAAHLEDALQHNQVEQSLAALLPEHDKYHRLKDALATYRQIADAGGWPELPSDEVLQTGDTSEIVLPLRERLHITGDLESLDALPVFDETLEAALQQYQSRNGLEADGVFGPQTAEVMNVPAEERVRQIQLNMERLRWWPESFGERYVMVNVPEYKLRVYDGGEQVMEMKVIVGEEYTSTPIFRDSIQYLEFSPTWTVPVSIARRDILPALQKDPGYLERNRMVLHSSWNREDSRELDPYEINWQTMEPDDFSYRVVQQPGPWNSLGAVKFMFPNERAIYLHDTPTEHLFEQTERAFSNGCVRVAEPVALAEFLLQDRSNWNTQRIRENMGLDSPEVVTLPEPIPIQFLYQTAFVDENGLVNFREDIYEHDRRQIREIPTE